MPRAPTSNGIAGAGYPTCSSHRYTQANGYATATRPHDHGCGREATHQHQATYPHSPTSTTKSVCYAHSHANRTRANGYANSDAHGYHDRNLHHRTQLNTHTFPDQHANFHPLGHPYSHARPDHHTSTAPGKPGRYRAHDRDADSGWGARGAGPVGFAHFASQAQVARRRWRGSLTMWNRDTGTHEFHIGAWSLWLFAAMLAALGTRNPFYLALVLVVALVVGRTVGQGPGARGQGSGTGREGGNYELRITNYGGKGRSRRGNPQSAIGGLWRIVVIVTLVVTVFKGLSNHYGETVMFSLPDWLPPPFAGPITVEGMSSAGLDALTLLTVLAVFGAFSAGADYYTLLRSVPSAMHGAALVTSIGITFVPQTIQRWSEIREAQALRGHRVRRIADLLPLVIPLLAGGMERSMNLAEAMEARGFSRATARARGMSPLLVQVGLVGGLGLLLTGGTMFAFVPGTPMLGWLLILLGLSLIALTLRGMSRGIKRTRYRRSAWRGHDTPLAIVSGGVLGSLIVFKLIAPSLLAYTPFLRISIPDFDPVVALTLCALIAPAAIIWLQSRNAV